MTSRADQQRDPAQMQMQGHAHVDTRAHVCTPAAGGASDSSLPPALDLLSPKPKSGLHEFGVRMRKLDVAHVFDGQHGEPVEAASIHDQQHHEERFTDGDHVSEFVFFLETLAIDRHDPRIGPSLFE